MSARIKQNYQSQVVPRLMKERSYSSVMAVPRLSKVVVNMGVGEATQNIKLLDAAMEELGRITGQRPAGWYHWAEVVFRDPATPKFIGDMPHTWVGSDYIRSVLDMFAYERESDSSLVVAAGVPESWVMERPGVTVRRLSTHYGPLSFTIRNENGNVRVPIAGSWGWFAASRLSTSPSG